MLTYSILSLLLSLAVTLRRENSLFYSRNTIIVLVYSFFISISTLYMLYLDKGIGLFGGLFHTTANTHVFVVFIYIISAIILQLTAFYPLNKKSIYVDLNGETAQIEKPLKMFESKTIDDYKKGEEYKILEYSLIILFIITGAILLISSSDLVSIFLSIELQSYGLYLLCTLYRNSEAATTSGLTYFLLGGLSSCFILLGTSLLYSNSGTTSLESLYVITNISDMINNSMSNMYNMLLSYKPNYINLSLLIMSVGFLFKMSAAPFHFWSPDVYDGIPTIVTTFVAIIAKISIFIFLLELVHYTSNSLFGYEFTWTTSLLISCLLSLIIGTVVGLTQTRIKRLYAYSTISHVGFILLALCINSIESIQAFIFYLMQYSISNLNAFIILISIGYYYYYYDNKVFDTLKDKKYSPIQLISQIKGYFEINPILAVSLGLTIFSFVGIPPLVGFFGKQLVLSAALDNGYVFLSLVAILTSVIGAVYYLGIIKQVFFDKSDYEFKKTNLMEHDNNFILDSNYFVLSNYLTLTISILTLIITLFIFIPEEWLSMANILAIILLNL